MGEFGGISVRYVDEEQSFNYNGYAWRRGNEQQQLDIREYLFAMSILVDDR